MQPENVKRFYGQTITFVAIENPPNKPDKILYIGFGGSPITGMIMVESKDWMACNEEIRSLMGNTLTKLDVNVGISVKVHTDKNILTLITTKP